MAMRRFLDSKRRKVSFSDIIECVPVQEPLARLASETVHQFEGPEVRLFPGSHVTSIAYTTPIAVLPSEILAEIFKVVPSSPTQRDYFPVLASHVCRRWREVASGYPGFWTEIIVMPNHPPEWTDTWLKRSKELPIDLTFDYRKLEMFDFGKHHIRPLPNLDVVVLHSHRWRQFVFMTMEDSVSTSSVMERLSNIPAPQLKSLRLLFRHDHGSENPHGSLPTPDLLTFSSLFSNLTTLELASPSVIAKPTIKEFREFVKVSHSLRNLMLYGSVIELEKVTPPIELPCLTFLSIGVLPCHDGYLPQLLEILITPMLESLEFCTLIDDEWPAFADFLRNDNDNPEVPLRYPALRTLTLVDVDTRPLPNFVHEPNGRLWLMRSLPELTHLLIINSDARPILDMITLSGKADILATKSPPLWPDLQSIAIPRQINFNLIRDLVTTRTIQGLPLTTLLLEPQFLAGLTVDERSWLESRVCVDVLHRKFYTEVWSTSHAWPARHEVPMTVDNATNAGSLIPGDSIPDWDDLFSSWSDDEHDDVDTSEHDLDFEDFINFSP